MTPSSPTLRLIKSLDVDEINKALREIQDSMFTQTQVVQTVQSTGAHGLFANRTGSPQTLGGSYVDVPGLTLTLDLKGNWLIRGVVFVSATSTAIPQLQLLLGGSPQIGNPVLNQGATSSTPLPGEWKINGIGVVKIQGKNTGTGTVVALGWSTLSALFLGP